MLIVKKPDNAIIKEIAKQVKAGAVIIYPTDTAYAIGCDATNAKAVANIFKIKGRDAGKALPIICADVEMVKKYFLISPEIFSIVSKYWPGPLSTVIGAKNKIAKAVLLKGTAAVRVPNSDIARQLSAILGRPLVATSANVSGKPNCYSVIAFLRQFSHNPFVSIKQKAIAVDAGALKRRKPSTIVRFGKGGTIEVLRKGPVKF